MGGRMARYIGLPLLVLIIIVAIVVFWAVSAYNRLVRLNSMKEEAWSGVLVQLKRRHDLIPNLVESVKGYSRHEQGIFEDVAEKRALAVGAVSPEQRGQAEQALSQSLGRIFALAENYPDLKASANFLSLQRSLAETEEHLQMARRYFNGTVRDYNILVQSFPSMILARFLGLANAEYFELDAPEEKLAPKVSF